MKSFFWLCLLKLFLDDKFMSNTLLSKISNLTNTFRLHHLIHWAQNWPIVCDAHKCKILNRTHRNSLMNSIVLRRNGSRNQLSFHYFSPYSITHFFISFTLKNLVKWLKSSNSRWRANKVQTIQVHLITLWNICVYRKTHVCVDVLL